MNINQCNGIDKSINRMKHKRDMILPIDIGKAFDKNLTHSHDKTYQALKGGRESCQRNKGHL